MAAMCEVAHKTARAKQRATRLIAEPLDRQRLVEGIGDDCRGGEVASSLGRGNFVIALTSTLLHVSTS
jgi:hypothetical protein